MAAIDVAAIPLLTTDAQTLAGARRVTFVLSQRFHYSYDRPVRHLDHRLVVIPRRRHGNDSRRLHALRVSVPHAVTTVGRDRSGNVSARIRVPTVADSIWFEVSAVVERVGPLADARVHPAALTHPRWLRPTRRTAADASIRTAAHDLASRNRLETAERLCRYVHDAVRYEFGITDVSTTAAEALAGGRGVCQDFAHVFLAMCRQLGIPARYVSGHLLGEGGTHAWAEVVVPDGDAARAVAFDPCNGTRAGAHYVTVAVGRDYGDVAPTSGTYDGTATSRLTASKRVGVTAIDGGPVGPSVTAP
jgi:transglutaminase-like putative cysteine protease